MTVTELMREMYSTPPVEPLPSCLDDDPTRRIIPGRIPVLSPAAMAAMLGINYGNAEPSIIDDEAEAIVIDDPFDDFSERQRMFSVQRRGEPAVTLDPNAFSNAALAALLFAVSPVGANWARNEDPGAAPPCGMCP